MWVVCPVCPIDFFAVVEVKRESVFLDQVVESLYGEVPRVGCF